MRCFYAIEFDEETRLVLAGIQNLLRKSGISGNYTRLSNFHLTLKFLGEVSPAMLPGLERVLGKVASRHDPFVLRLGELGKFSRRNRPIIWCGLEASRPLMKLQKDLAEELASQFSQFSGHERYSPHITLIREADIQGNAPSGTPHGESGGEEPGDPIDDLLGRVKRPDHKIMVRGVSLMESTREDGKLVYLRKSFLALGDK